MILSAIRNITDKGDGPSEPPCTAAKSALEQDATRAGSIRPTAAGGKVITERLSTETMLRCSNNRT
ncbi:hypothetical protein CU276_20195 [Yersinia kristensenii]|nr:hypothetical protein CU276_20195 [Yersinia kristensenii]